MNAFNATVIRAYESNIGGLEPNKVRLEDQLTNWAEPKGKIDEMLVIWNWNSHH